MAVFISARISSPRRR